VLEQQRRVEDAVRVATLALEMAKTPEEKQAASATLAGAQQFQDSWAKYQAMQDDETSEDDAETPRLMSTGPVREVSLLARMTMLTNPQGVDFASYLSKEVIPKVQQEWGARVQRVGLALATKRATAVLEFAIEKDGSVTGVELKQSTQEPKLDDAVREAIREASPFAPLPPNFRGKAITLRFNADYNSEPAEPEAEAKEAAGKNRK
jgi:TonB family protein